ncbi:MAG: hypothetical protein NTW27_14975 [Deltaproteobacteria bacterium]|nr:hypothetical protein [Deltaproteobacteria bacterium]
MNLRINPDLVETLIGLHESHIRLVAAQRIFGIPNFRYYALADGIREILGKAGNGTLHQKRHKRGPNDQLPLFWR